MATTFEDLLERKNKGSLKIYLGYAAGVGKTFGMLSEAQRLRKQGFDVVAGYVEPHKRPETQKLLEGLESIATQNHKIGEQCIQEMDTQAIIKRNPQIVLIDELAHTNAPFCQNSKRYLDVFEILDAGINVITTLNIQHVESIAIKVDQAIRVPVNERVPDFVFRRADQVVNVDVTIEDLRDRLRMGKIYNKEKAELALVNFFSHENLSFLRKLALQEATVDQLRKIEEEGLLSERGSIEADETVMVALSSDPSSAETLIRKGTKMASQLSSRCFVVYVQRQKESPDRIDLSLQRKLHSNLRLAEDLGATVEKLEGQDVAEILVNFAHKERVKHAFFGKTRRTPLQDRLFGSIVNDFIFDSIGVDIHIVSELPYIKE